ncbi:SixA phosphatase family protein [Asticcacaulis tiandongensis]|uniref:SixA phosphatase family protein n=1 Tax=Asticcacaulis tiandongensis TaxID=2565365 RepID=UPI001FE9B28B|nr:histidine phosphatase family protein [Asticcacaulis tiandongensis]
MKRLIVMRHGKAEKEAESGEDFDRALAERGVAEAKAVAEALKSYGVKPDYALVSQAARTQGTFRAVQSVLGDIEADIRKDMFDADSYGLRDIIEAHEAAGDTILVVGHNPAVQYLILDYMVEASASIVDMDKIRAGYPTATATLFDIDAAGRAQYDGLFSPRDLIGA